MSIKEAQQKKKKRCNFEDTIDHPQYNSAPNMKQMLLEVGRFEHSEVNEFERPWNR